MARTKIKTRKITASLGGEQSADDRASEELDRQLDTKGYSGSPGPAPMLVLRGPKNIKQPTPKEIQGMKNREFQRKNPFTNA